MDCGWMATGIGFDTLYYDYVRECVRKGLAFHVTWYDTEDEAHGHVICDEQERCIGWRSQAEVDGILRTREASRNRAVGLADLELDEQGSKE